MAGSELETFMRAAGDDLREFMEDPKPLDERVTENCSTLSGR